LSKTPTTDDEGCVLYGWPRVTNDHASTFEDGDASLPERRHRPRRNYYENQQSDLSHRVASITRNSIRDRPSTRCPRHVETAAPPRFSSRRGGRFDLASDTLRCILGKNSGHRPCP